MATAAPQPSDPSSAPASTPRNDARVVDIGGVPTICVDGRPVPPMTFCSRHYSDAGYIGRLYERGIRVFFVFTRLPWLDPTAPERLRADCARIASVAPEAKIIVRVNVDAPAAWIAAHPDETATFQDGSRHPQYSFASRAWLDEASRSLAAYVDEVERGPIGERSLGWFLNAGGTEEWYYQRYDYWTKCLDWSPAFRAYWSAWLTARYGDEDALRRAWRDPTASLAAPEPPPLADRRLCRVDREYNAGRFEHRLDVGAILDPDRSRRLMDFYEAFNDATADALVSLARVVKRRTAGRRLVGAFQGALGCVLYHEFGTSSLRRVLASGVVDFLSAPSNYENRLPGGSASFTNPIDGMRAHNVVWFNEEDQRTHQADPRDLLAAPLGLAASIELMRRESGKTLCDTAQSWWFENCERTRWWDHPDLLREIGRTQELAAWAATRDRRKRCEIAFVYSHDSLWTCDQETLKDVFQHNKMFELERIGAPADHLFVDDLADPRFHGYKLYVFMNTVSLTAAQRALIAAVVRRPGRTALWLHASGLVDPGATPALSLDHASALTGIRLGMAPVAIAGSWVAAGDHGMLAGLPRDRVFGDFDAVVDATGMYWNRPGTPFRATRLDPLVHADDPAATVVGRSTVFGWDATHPAATAVAVKAIDGWTSIHYAAKALNAAVVRAIAAHAGVHRYLDRDDLLYANRLFVSVHARGDGERVIRLPRRSDVEDVYAGAVIGRDVDRVAVAMRHGETRLLRLLTPD